MTISNELTKTAAEAAREVLNAGGAQHHVLLLAFDDAAGRMYSAGTFEEPTMELLRLIVQRVDNVKAAYEGGVSDQLVEKLGLTRSVYVHKEPKS
jgi:hypothetical protein